MKKKLKNEIVRRKIVLNSGNSNKEFIINVYKDDIIVNEIIKSLDDRFGKMDCDDPKIIVDLGANIGITALYFSLKFPNAKIIAVEPSKENFKILKMNIKTNNLFNVKPVRAAVDYSGDKTIKLFKSVNIDSVWGYEHWGFTSEKGLVSKNRMDLNIFEEVKTTTLSKLLNGSNPDVVKIDIEGVEEGLIDNEYELLNKAQFIQVEFHSEDYLQQSVVEKRISNIKTNISYENSLSNYFGFKKAE